MRSVAILIAVRELIERRILGVQQRPVPTEEVLVDRLG
jgi:hypothetical protein